MTIVLTRRSSELSVVKIGVVPCPGRGPTVAVSRNTLSGVSFRCTYLTRYIEVAVNLKSHTRVNMSRCGAWNVREVDSLVMCPVSTPRRTTNWSSCDQWSSCGPWVSSGPWVSGCPWSSGGPWLSCHKSSSSGPLLSRGHVVICTDHVDNTVTAAASSSPVVGTREYSTREYSWGRHSVQQDLLVSRPASGVSGVGRSSWTALSQSLSPPTRL